MSFDWNEYLDFAIEQQKAVHPSCFRSGVSRAYYAVFHKGKEFKQKCFFHKKLKKADFMTKNFHEHEEVWETLKTVPEFKKMVEECERLRSRRVEADYHCDAHVTQGILKKACDKADELIKQMDNYTF